MTFEQVKHVLQRPNRECQKQYFTCKNK